MTFTKIKLLIIFCGITAGISAQDVAFVKEQLSILASDSMAGRGYVDNGMKRAANYLEREFKNLGLESVDGSYRQYFEYSVNTFPEKLVVTVDSNNLIAGEDYLVDPLSGSDSGVFKIHLIDSADLANEHFQLNAEDVAVVPVSVLQNKFLQGFLDKTVTTNPVVLLTNKKLTWSVGREYFPHALLQIKEGSAPTGATTMEIQVKNKFVPDFKASNVIGVVPGKRSDSIIVFTAHYDHLGKMGEALFPGASDNGSGVAMLLDLAGFYSKNKPEYKTVFIAFAGEEAGLLGSYYFVQHPLFKLSNTKLLINLDLMGSARDGITVVNGLLYPNLMEKLKTKNADQFLLPKIKLRGEAANSDHYWFSEKGIPAVFIYTMGSITAYHDINDVPEGVAFENYNSLFTLITNFVSTL